MCARIRMLSVSVRASTSPDLQAFITQAHLALPFALHHTHITPSQAGPCQRQTSWVTPLQKDPLLTNAYQLVCWTPSAVNPPAFLSPIRALVGSSISRPQGGGFFREGDSCGQAISWLVFHPSFQPPLKPLAETEDHSLVLCPTLFQPNRETEAHYSKNWV